MSQSPIIHAKDIHKTYRLGRVDVPVLRGASLSVNTGEWVSILGASGSGKSTLLHLLGGLDRCDRKPAGSIAFQGTELVRLSAGAMNRYRSRSVGFVFQFYHLLPELTVLENVLAGAMVRHSFGYLSLKKAMVSRAGELLEVFGLSERLKHRPAELSGGERQRVAIARALINEPDILLADEPTGNLDTLTGNAILDELAKVRSSRGLTLIMVTHDIATARRGDRLVELIDGVVGEQSPLVT